MLHPFTRAILWICIVFSFLVIYTPAESALSGESSSEWKAKADALIEDAEVGYSESDILNYEMAVELYEKAASEQSNDFETNWKTAKACRLYGEEARKREIPRWEDICAEYGRKGMFYAQKAIDLAPDKPEGYFYYGLCAGTYSDGVGLFTALREGLKDKVRMNLETAYRIDKTFDDGAPMVALGRFWQRVPWPYSDEEKAMRYYREMQQSKFFNNRGNIEVRVFMAEILMEKRGDIPQQEARQLLRQIPELTDDPYWINLAQDMLEQLED